MPDSDTRVDRAKLLGITHVQSIPWFHSNEENVSERDHNTSGGVADEKIGIES